MKSRRKAERVVRRRLADGSVKEYHYGAYKPKRPKLPSDTLGALLRAYLRSPEWTGLKQHTRDTYSIYLRPLDRLGHLRLKDFKRRDLLTLRDGISTGRGNGAATGFVRAASALFGWAVEHEWLEHSPVHRVKKLPAGHLPAWTQEQADIALARLPEHLRRAVILARYTGARRGDLCRLTWAAYDGATIRYTPQKTERNKASIELVIPVHPALKDELDAWRAGCVAGIAAAPILTNTLKRQWKRPEQLSSAMKKGLAAIGLPSRLNVHGLRKLAAAALAEAGCSANEIAAITGHQTLSMVQLYTRSADQRRLADAALGRLLEFTTIEKREKS